MKNRANFPQRGDAQPVLQEGACFEQHVIVRKQRRPAIEQPAPNRLGGGMVVIVAIKHSVKRRAIDEDRHVLYASAR